MSGGARSSTGNPGSASNPVLGAGIGGAAAAQAQTPQWLQGLRLGTQLAGMGQHPQVQGGMGPPPQQPMMGAGGMPGGMPQGGLPQAVPGAIPQQPMMGVGQGMPPQGMGGINPQLLQMLMRSRQQ